MSKQNQITRENLRLKESTILGAGLGAIWGLLLLGAVVSSYNVWLAFKVATGSFLLMCLIFWGVFDYLERGKKIEETEEKE